MAYTAPRLYRVKLVREIETTVDIWGKNAAEVRLMDDETLMEYWHDGNDNYDSIRIRAISGT